METSGAPLPDVERVVPQQQGALVSRLIDGIESLRVPKFVYGDGEVPPVTGLRNLVYGTQPACETVSIVGIRPPRYLCYMLSGFICDGIQLAIDFLLHFVFLLKDASLCWMLGFGLSIVFRHTTHRYLVFGDYVGGYWKSLGRMYAGYSITIVLSTVFNFVMTRYILFPHYVAFVVTLLWTGIVNYFILKRLWSFGGKDKQEILSTVIQQTPVRRSFDQDNQVVQRKRIVEK